MGWYEIWQQLLVVEEAKCTAALLNNNDVVTTVIVAAHRIVQPIDDVDCDCIGTNNENSCASQSSKSMQLSSSGRINTK